MPKHDVRLQLKAEVPIRNVDIVIPVYIDGELRGKLEISTGTVDWRPRKAQYSKSLSWTRFAALMEEHGR